jgi:monovalent cation:H+ antiporter-2, CPA2 family
MHDTALVSTIAISLVCAFIGGFVAHKLRLSPIVGYLLVGIVIGPHTPGLVADPELAQQLSEIGVILLMFGVGMHFSIKDLLSVRGIAIPGALLQITVATTFGALLALNWGWSPGAAIFFGLALSVASTVVLIKALEVRNALKGVDGRIAVGWLVVEDLVMVLALVLLPALAPILQTADGASSSYQQLLMPLGTTIAKVTTFVVFMVFAGRRLAPWLLRNVAATGSRELFTLFVIGSALGIAFVAAQLFEVSVALGAFFAGVVMSESDLSHRAAAKALPFQDAFAVLFFVSVGMLFDPDVLVTHPLQVASVLAIVLCRGVRFDSGIPLPTAHRCDRRRQFGADRRVLFHSRGAGYQPGRVAKPRIQSDSCRLIDFNRLESCDVCPGHTYRACPEECRLFPRAQTKRFACHAHFARRAFAQPRRAGRIRQSRKPRWTPTSTRRGSICGD